MVSPRGRDQARCAGELPAWARGSRPAPELPLCVLQAVERARRGAGAGSDAGRKGQPGPGGLRPRVAAAGRAPSPEAARERAELRTQRPVVTAKGVTGAARGRGFIGVLLGFPGKRESRGSPQGYLAWASLLKPALRWNRPVRAAWPGVSEPD